MINIVICEISCFICGDLIFPELMMYLNKAALYLFIKKIQGDKHPFNYLLIF